MRFGNPIDRLSRRLPQPWRSIVDWGLTIAIAVGAVLLIKAFVVNPYRIPSASMEPTFHCAAPGLGCEGSRSDRVIANRFIYHFKDPERGDIVVFDTPKRAEQACGIGGVFVKRIVGLPGETIAQEGGAVFINGTALDEPYLEPGRAGRDSFAPISIGAGEYFMMGDNRSQSCDSRNWGTVPRDNLIGSVFFVYWPVDRIGFR
ncbi:MAG: signal peptidase I [Gaiellales bacterium]